jgi:hypothetical protein
LLGSPAFESLLAPNPVTIRVEIEDIRSHDRDETCVLRTIPGTTSTVIVGRICI